MQPDFERLRKALLCEEPDRVPIAELEIDPSVMEAFLGRPIRGITDGIDFWQQAGYDYYILNLKYVVADLFDDLPTSETVSCYGDRPVERRWTWEHEGSITRWQDLEKLPSTEPRPADYEPINEVLRALPEGMGFIVHLGGFFEYIWQLMGFERFSMALVDEPELVSTLWHWLDESLMKHFSAVMDFEGIDGIWLCDDIAYTEGLIVSPSILRQHVFPCHKEIGKACRSRGIPLIYHSDGDLTQVMDDLLDNGITALHPIEPKGMDIYELKRRYGGRLALVGNMDLGSTLTRGTPEEVRQDVRTHINALAPGGGYVLGSSNSIPNYVPIENYRAMIEAAAEWGRYPIGGT